MSENYGLDILALFLLAIPVTGLAAAIKRFFPRLSMYSCFAISIMIAGSILYALIYFGSHVGV